MAPAFSPVGANSRAAGGRRRSLCGVSASGAERVGPSRVVCFIFPILWKYERCQARGIDGCRGTRGRLQFCERQRQDATAGTACRPPRGSPDQRPHSRRPPAGGESGPGRASSRETAAAAPERSAPARDRSAPRLVFPRRDDGRVAERAARRELRKPHERERLEVVRQHPRERSGIGAVERLPMSPTRAPPRRIPRTRRRATAASGPRSGSRTRARLGDRALLDREIRKAQSRAAILLAGPRAGTSQPSARSTSMLMPAQFIVGVTVGELVAPELVVDAIERGLHERRGAVVGQHGDEHAATAGTSPARC